MTHFLQLHKILTATTLYPAVDKTIICLKKTSAFPLAGGRNMIGERTAFGPASYSVHTRSPSSSTIICIDKFGLNTLDQCKALYFKGSPVVFLFIYVHFCLSSIPMKGAFMIIHSQWKLHCQKGSAGYRESCTD